MADVIYFLDCQRANGSRSAIAHFGVADLEKFNAGAKPTPPRDEFTWVTPSSWRKWEGFMYDVTFDAVGGQANHFRFMINPDARGFKENQLCGWSAKVEPNDERSQLIPIYRGDDGAFMNIGGYLCYRRYYCTCAQPPSNTFKDRYPPDQKPPPLFTCAHPKIRKGLEHHVAEEGDPVAADGDGVETPLDITSDGDVVDAPNVPLQDQPQSGPDPDQFAGENVDNKLYEDNEH